MFLPTKWTVIVILLLYLAIQVAGDDDDFLDTLDQNDTGLGGEADDLEEAEFDVTTTEEAKEEQVNNYYFLPGVLAVAIILMFCFFARICYAYDYQFKKSGSFITLENVGTQPMSHSHVYLIIVDTGTWGNCGTTNRVRIEFHARSFCSRVLCLQPNNIVKSILLRGHRDIFVLKTAGYMNGIQTLNKPNSYHTQLPISTTLLLWPIPFTQPDETFLECIRLIDVSHSQEWKFPCYRWLSTGNRPSMVAKLFPSGQEQRHFVHKLENEFLEMHTWASLLHTYNRLGRLTRLERLALCFNMMMMQLAGYTLTMVNPESFSMPEADDLTVEADMAKAVVLCLFVSIVVSSVALIPEYILRHAEPWGWEFYNLEQMISDVSCLGCSPVGLPFTGDMALPTENNPCLSPWHNTLECEICMNKTEEAQHQFERNGPTPAEARFLEPFMGDNEPRQNTNIQSNSCNQAKMHEQAERYVEFFSRWKSFCSQFSEVIEELKEHLDSNSSSGKSSKLFRAMSWILDAMIEIQLQNQFVKQQQEPTPRSSNLSTVDTKKQLNTIPAELLLPVAGLYWSQPVPTSHHDAEKAFALLTRSFAIVLLTTVCDNIQYFKTVCVSSYSHLGSDLVMILQRSVCTLLHALEAFSFSEGQLCKISDGTITAYFENTEDFLRDYLQSKDNCDYDFPECSSITCHLLKTTKTITPFSGDETQMNEPQTTEVDDGGNKKKTEEDMIAIKNRIRDFTQLTVADIVRNLVLAMDVRRPLHTLYDFIQYKTMSQQSLEWTSVCVEYMLPLLTSITCPLVKHCLEFLNNKLRPKTLHQIDKFLETLVMNAALKASCDMDTSNISCHDWMQLVTSSKCLDATTDDEPETMYNILIQKLAKCMLRNNAPTPHSTFCSEGKMHLLDKRVLRMMMDEGRLRAVQLATPEMVKLLVSVINDMQPQMKQVQQFISHALVYLTEAQEESTDCKPDPFVDSFRQRLLDLGFIALRMLQKSMHLAASKDTGKEQRIIEPPAYWSMPRYQDLSFLQKVAQYKGGLLKPDEIPPLSLQEQNNIQGLAFAIHKAKFSERFTIAVYFYIGIQTICILALVFYVSGSWKTRTSIACSVVFASAMAIDFLLVQPLKVIAIVLYLERVAKKKLNKMPKKKKKKKKDEHAEHEPEKTKPEEVIE